MVGCAHLFVGCDCCNMAHHCQHYLHWINSTLAAVRQFGNHWLCSNRPDALPVNPMAQQRRSLEQGWLSALPAQLTDHVWSLLEGDAEARRRLMQTSPSVRALFSPSVQSLRVSLAGPSSSVLAGLSRNIRARKLTLVGEAVSDQTEEQKDQLCAAVSVVSMSQLLRHVVDLTLKSMHLDVEAALHLSPLLHGIEALHLQGCYANRSLAVLGNCRHLEQLSLVNTQLAAGAAEALHVLAAEGSPGLQLTLDHVKGSQPSSVVAALAPCVSHLDVKTTTIQELRAVLNTAVQKQCPRLQHIHLSTTEGGHLSLPLMGIRQLATACPQLHSLTCPRIVLPSMHCLRALLEMPQLQQLTINSARDSDELAAFIRWPPGKMPMSLHMERITPSEMAALPLEFCSDMLARFLYIPPGHTRLQLAEGMRAALLNAAKCPQVQVHVIRGSIPILGEQLAPGAGLSALAAGCPLQPRHREEASLLFLALEAEDIQGLAAAWGTSLKYLGLTNCTLSASAWAALAAAHLPALETINLWSIQDAQQLAAHLVAFFLAWPSTRNLRVKVPEDVATQWLSTWSDILQAHQRHNIQLVAA